MQIPSEVDRAFRLKPIADSLIGVLTDFGLLLEALRTIKTKQRAIGRR